MRSLRTTQLSVVVVALLGAAVAACATQPGGGGSPATSSSTSTPTASPSSSSSSQPPTSSSSTTVQAGVVWPIETRTLPALSGVSGAVVLRGIRTGEHETYERLVLDFSGAYGAVAVHYVPVVRADPSDKVVSLEGTAFLQVSVQSAVAAWGGPQLPYSGPSTVTPRYSTLRQIKISGDFEAVLSFGVGLNRVAGFTIMRLRSPDRLVIDVAKRPVWRMWPDDIITEARSAQTQFESGHLAWRADPVAVVRQYAHDVYGWSTSVVTKLGTDGWYRLAHTGSSDSVNVHVVWPFSDTKVNSICEIAETR